MRSSKILHELSPEICRFTICGERHPVVSHMAVHSGRGPRLSTVLCSMKFIFISPEIFYKSQIIHFICKQGTIGNFNTEFNTSGPTNSNSHKSASGISVNIILGVASMSSLLREVRCRGTRPMTRSYRKCASLNWLIDTLTNIRYLPLISPALRGWITRGISSVTLLTWPINAEDKSFIQVRQIYVKPFCISARKAVVASRQTLAVFRVDLSIELTGSFS